MEPQFVERDAFTVVGYLDRHNPSEADYEGLWSEQFERGHAQLRSISTDGAYYALYYGTDEGDLVDFVAGMAVSEIPTDLPEGFVVREVPASRFAVFGCTMSQIGATWDAIYREWLPTSRYTPDADVPAFEVFPPEAEEDRERLAIYVPLRSS